MMSRFVDGLLNKRNSIPVKMEELGKDELNILLS